MALSSLVEDSNQNLWFGLSRGYVIRHTPAKQSDPETWQLHGPGEGFDIQLEWDWRQNTQLCSTEDGVIWATGRRTPHRFDGRRWSKLEGVPDFVGNFRGYQSSNGTVWFAGRGVIFAFDAGEWRHYTGEQLPVPFTRRICGFLETDNGYLWVAFLGGEAYRIDYGSKRWESYAGLAFQCENSEGTKWFISQDREAVRLDQRGWTRFGVEDGLMDTPEALLLTRDEMLWAGGSHDSVASTASFDGERWTTRIHPELAYSVEAHGIHESRDGRIWFAAHGDYSGARGHKGGFVRYSGQEWEYFPSPVRYCYGIGETSDGKLWFGGYWGLFTFQDAEWDRLSRPSQVTTAPAVDDLLVDRTGSVWVGTRRYGLLAFNGEEWVRHGLHHGLASDEIRSIAESERGIVAATAKGYSLYDGNGWTRHVFDQDLPIIERRFGSIRIGNDGTTWISKGLSRKPTRDSTWTVGFRPSAEGPETEITTWSEEVTYPGNLTIAWQGNDRWGDTPKGDLQYAWRFDSGTWSSFGLTNQHVFGRLSSGDHTFEVKARDRDFNVDPTPASMTFTVIPPVWQRLWFILMVVTFFAVIAVQTRRIFLAKQRLLNEAVAELQTAHNMQMSLMPTIPPSVAGFEIAGRCVTANHVGGDLFQYFQSQETLTIALADVTGKAMDAAIPAVMFSGILDNQMEEGRSIRELFPRLNRSLNRSLDTRTFICFELAEIDLATRTVRYCNGGLPYPYHLHDGEVSELQVDTYPLGVRSDTEYEVIERQLAEGDYLVFCSDGIAEAERAQGEQFGYSRTSEAVKSALEEGLTAEGVIDHLLSAVDEFRGDADQTDDMTCVVVRVTGEENGT